MSKIDFCFIDPATAKIYTLSLHDALPICRRAPGHASLHGAAGAPGAARGGGALRGSEERRSEEHTSELQSRRDLVCRLLLEKKKFSIKCARSVRARHLLITAPPAESRRRYRPTNDMPQLL